MEEEELGSSTIIMGLALSSKKFPWEVANRFLFMEIHSQTTQLEIDSNQEFVRMKLPLLVC